jgi:hypothetical protein
MTVKQVAEFFGKSESTIRRVSKDIGISFENGKVKLYVKDEVESLSRILFKTVPLAVKNAINETFPNNQGIALPNEEVNNNLENMFMMFMQQQQKTNEILLNLIQDKQSTPQLEYKQDYFTLKGYCIYKGIEMPTVSELRIIGKDASKLSREKEIDIKKESDSSYGYVNSYFIDILNLVFEF